MKRIFTFSAVLLVMLTVSSSCTVAKRQFRNGWHVEWNRKATIATEAETAAKSETETVPAAIRQAEPVETAGSTAGDDAQTEQAAEPVNAAEQEQHAASERKPIIRAGTKSAQKLKRVSAKVVRTITSKEQLDTRPNTVSRSHTAAVSRDPDDGEFLGIDNSVWVDYLVGAAIVIGICALIVLAILYPFVADLLGALMALASIIVVIWAICKVFSFFGDYLFWSGR